MWRPDFRDPVTSDIRVRKAIGYALPYDAYIAAQGLQFGITARPAATLLPPGTPGRLDYHVLETAPGQTDPAKARELLAAAGYEPGDAELSFAYESDDPYSVATKNVLVRALERAGFKVAPRATSSFEEYLAVDADPHAPINLRSGGFGGWCADWPSGSSWIPILFGSGNIQNAGHFSEPSVDADIERIKGLPLEQQLVEWGKLDKRIATEYYPVVVTDYGMDALLRGSRIRGMNNDSVLGTPTFKDMYVKADSAG
jgi:peptide/nickel transport system substrate-binding protein